MAQLTSDLEQDFEWVTNIKISDQFQQRSFYEALGKDVRFWIARTLSWEIIRDMLSLEVKDKVFTAISSKVELLLNKINLNYNNGHFYIEDMGDFEAKFYRGTILGFVLVALMKSWKLASFDPDRDGYKSMETTVVTNQRNVAIYYAEMHGLNLPTAIHDIRGISSQLNISPELIKTRYPSLLSPVILHFKWVPATENPMHMNEYQTNSPLNLYVDLTTKSREQLELLLGMSLTEIWNILT